jgi:hypothetical protein
MSYSDWEFFGSNSPTLSFSINVLTPIIGLGSGRLGSTSLPGGGSIGNINVTTASLLTEAVPRGKLRSLFRYTSLPGTNSIFGFLCMQTSTNLSTSTGSFYSLTVQGDGFLKLVKVVGGNVFSILTGTPGLVRFNFDSVPFSVGNNTVFSLELEWIADATELGGVALFCRTGFATDFSDLVTVMSYLDVTAPIFTTVSEGIGIHEQSSEGPYFIDFDQTTLFIP